MEDIMQSDREITITRIVDAPRELVFKMWTVPEHLAKWWGPKDFTNPVCETDVRPGGKWRQVMKGPDGAEYAAHSVYLEVDEPSKLVYKDDPEASDGHAPATTNTITFEEQGSDRTKLIIHTTVGSKQDRDKMMEMGYSTGMNESLDRLETALPKA